MIKISNQNTGSESRIMYTSRIMGQDKIPVSVYDFIDTDLLSLLPTGGLLSWDYTTKTETTTSILSQELVTYSNWYELDLELNKGNFKSKIAVSDLTNMLLLNGSWKSIVDIVVGDKLACFPNRDDDRYKTVNGINKFKTSEDFLNLKTKSGEYVSSGVWIKCID
jgi:hypothetical protein